jgi:hypothetical protein
MFLPEHPHGAAGLFLNRVHLKAETLYIPPISYFVNAEPASAREAGPSAT